MFSLKLEAEGQSIEDIEDALHAALTQVRDGYTSGFDRGDGRSYSFDVEEQSSVSEKE